MITKYKTVGNKWYIIAEMEDDHLMNAHRYFAVRRLSLSQKKGITGKDLLTISLLINALWQEIDKRELYKY